MVNDMDGNIDENNNDTNADEEMNNDNLLIVPKTNAISYAVDAGDPPGIQMASSWSCAKSEGFNRAIIQCYSEYCAQGGGISSTCLGNYQNAIAAGYKYIDLYFFPCTGVAYNLQTIWIDFEIDNTLSCSQNWSQDKASNLALAKQFTEAAKATSLNWGIYSTYGQWITLFGDAQAVVDSSFKIWYANYQTPPQPNYDDWNSSAFGGFITPSGKKTTTSVALLTLIYSPSVLEFRNKNDRFE
ncbi:Glycoside Hydrolase Family 25 protein [Gigaspora rosea]|uniref:Glycoside Hydrolase Family 25 protein n=1 Tax=Gigaspora rosea TaxID=44941 RepID=A0A397V004_9GLOM|nr:Glycoside Hydrolase Family 25 protein [Gigaspora rosea]